MKQHFVICIKNKGYDASLEKRKLYEALPDKEAELKGLIRVKDESGEDYLYPKELFVAADLSDTIQKAINEAV